MKTDNTTLGHPERKLEAGPLLARLEREILSGDDPERMATLLDHSGTWRKLSPKDQIEWARLARLAGRFETALDIYGHLNRSEPSLDLAWEDHAELLVVLDQREPLAKLLELARRGSREDLAKRYQDLTVNRAPSHDRALEAATEPFVRMADHQSRLEHYLDLFHGRQDCFARQWADRAEGRQGYSPVWRPMTPRDLEDHLKGLRTYGIYLLQPDATIRVAVLDADLHKEFREVRQGREQRTRVGRDLRYLVGRLREISAEMGLEPVVEFSGGKGYHFWYFFRPAIPASAARCLLEQVKGVLAPDLSCFNLEVFPKQDYLSGKGLGNLVKLPLGVHRLSGKRSWFTDCAQRDVDSQLGYLAAIRSTDPVALASLQGSQGGKVIGHPRLARQYHSFPELKPLLTRCPPLAGIIGDCLAGRNVLVREEKILFQTIGFLGQGRTLMHRLLSSQPEFNPHFVDFKISRLRGTPLGCRRIHGLTGFAGDYCRFERQSDYAHPLLHYDDWSPGTIPPASEKVRNLSEALESLKAAVAHVERYIH